MVYGSTTVGLTEDRARTMAESRLGAARPYAPELLVLSVLDLVIGPLDKYGSTENTALVAKRRFGHSADGSSEAASVDLGLLPRVLAHTNDLNGADSIMQSLTVRADALFANHLRVNEGYC